MNWLQDNPVGKALLYLSGALLLVAVIITIAWSLPVNVDGAEALTDERGGQESVTVARDLTALNDLQVINQRPVFNENRLPAVDEDEGGEGDLDTSIEVTGAPDVKLTGVIITPEMKIATLTPASGSQENVMAHEGESLVGEYVGWAVAEVNPRAVLLRSKDGQDLQLELQVHDSAIKEPPKPVPAPATTSETAAQPAVVRQETPPLNSNAESISRAEQIRARIAERREQLRLEQEARESQLRQERGEAPGGSNAAPARSAYQNAIRGLMQGGGKKDGNKDKEDDG